MGYFDKFSKNAWLNMMKERIILARELLKDDGVIFVSLDDNMQAYFKVMMDEIFGEENFQTNLIWVSNKKGRQISSNLFSKTYEYVVVYTKKENSLNYVLDRNFAENTMKCIYEKKDIDILSDKKSEFIIQNELHNTNINEFNVITRPFLFYPIFLSEDKISTNYFDGSIEIYPPKNKENKQGVWRWSKEKLLKEYDDLYWYKHNDTYKIYTKKRDIVYNFKNIILSSKITTKTGSSEMQNLDINFSFPKPSNLLKLLLINSNKNAKILDFFAGSGTTGHAVLDLNREDGGNREFILVTKEYDSGKDEEEQQNNIAKDVCWERLYRINNGKTSSGDTDFDWVKKNQPYNNSLDVYRLKEVDVSLDNVDFSKLENSFKFYKELNPSIDLNIENSYKVLYPLLKHLGVK